MFDEPVRNLRARFCKASQEDGKHVPAHVLRRINALVGNHDGVLYDISVEWDGRAKTNGTAVMFTNSVVVRAAWKGASAHVEYGGQGDNAQVDVMMWPRHLLRLITTPSNGGQSEQALNLSWQEATEEGCWPPGAKIELHYAPPGEKVILPGGYLTSEKRSRELSTFIRELHDELSRSSPS